MNTGNSWEHVHRILCIRLDNIGDVLMTTPAIRALRSSVPGRHITLLASQSGAMLAPYLADVDRVMTYEAPWVKTVVNDQASDHGTIELLQRYAFEAAVIFTVYTQSALPAALMCRLAGIPLVLAHVRENPYHLLSHWVRDSEPEGQVRHEVQRQLDLVATVGATCPDTRLSLLTTDADQYALDAVLRSHSLSTDDGLIVVHGGASAPSRRYSPARYARVISLLQDKGFKVVLTGTQGEHALIADIVQQCTVHSNLINLTGLLSLGELACLIKGARLLVCNNSGPAHIAAAVQTPVVDLYALTNPQHRPWMVSHRLLYHDVSCRNCYSSVCKAGTNACLEGIEPDEVVTAAMELLACPAQTVQNTQMA